MYSVVSSVVIWLLVARSLYDVELTIGLNTLVSRLVGVNGVWPSVGVLSVLI